jgi:hypothetical protein
MKLNGRGPNSRWQVEHHHRFERVAGVDALRQWIGFGGGSVDILILRELPIVCGRVNLAGGVLKLLLSGEEEFRLGADVPHI